MSLRYIFGDVRTSRKKDDITHAWSGMRSIAFSILSLGVQMTEDFKTARVDRMFRIASI